MNRPFPWLWIALAAALLLLPGPAGRLLLDLLGGLTLTLLLLPVLVGVAGWIGWQVLRSRLRTCQVCGVSSFAADVCPACGAPRAASDVVGEPPFSQTFQEIDASQVTINVEAVEVDVPSAEPPESDH